jgi:hypothetical protein
MNDTLPLPNSVLVNITRHRQNPHPENPFRLYRKCVLKGDHSSATEPERSSLIDLNKAVGKIESCLLSFVSENPDLETMYDSLNELHQ